MERIAGVNVLVKGRVQGVFFRSETQKAAKEIGVTGWVKNLPDGRVEAYFEGERSLVEMAVRWCERGAPLSRVEGVETKWREGTGKYNDFQILYR